MAAYPNIPTEKVYQQFDKIGNDSCVYHFPWGKKIYGFADGKVTAIIPLAIVYTHRQGGCYASGSLWAKVAGKGETYYPLGAKFFATTDDYVDYINGCKTRELVIREERAINVLGRCGYELGYASLGTIHINGWHTTSYRIEPRKDYMTIKQMWFDAEGMHINFVENGRQFIKYEDALRQQKKNIQIVDFDDEETTAEVKEFSLNINISIKATTKSMASEEIVKAMQKIGYNVTID